MKILVTGGCGFIGSNLIRYLLTNYQNIQVVNLDKLTYAAHPLSLADVANDKRYQFIKGDICDELLVERVFSEEKPDVLLHLAAESHVDRSINQPAPFLKTNVFGTYVLLEAVKKHKITRMVHVSTDEVYGSIERGSFSEKSPLSPSSPYSASKAASDLLVLSYFKTYHLPLIITRSSNNFGPYQFPEKFISRLITNAILKQNLPIYGNGQNVRDWIFVLDNCCAIDLVLQKGKIGEVYNIGAKNEKTNLEVALEIQKRFPDVRIQFVADRPGHDFRYSLDTTRIQKLGFRPKYSFKKALSETIDWYLDNQWWWRPLKERSETFYRNWGR